MLDVWRPVNREGSDQGETKCIPITTSDSLLKAWGDPVRLTSIKKLKKIHNLIHIPSLRIGVIWGKWSWMSQEGRTLGRYEALQVDTACKAYILTYYRLWKRNSLIALGQIATASPGGDGPKLLSRLLRHAQSVVGHGLLPHTRRGIPSHKSVIISIIV